MFYCQLERTDIRLFIFIAHPKRRCRSRTALAAASAAVAAAVRLLDIPLHIAAFLPILNWKISRFAQISNAAPPTERRAGINRSALRRNFSIQT